MEPIGPAYDDPVTWKKDIKATSHTEETEYINTAECIAYRPNVAAMGNSAFNSSTSQRSVLPLSSSPTDEYEVMQQLNYSK